MCIRDRLWTRETPKPWNATRLKTTGGEPGSFYSSPPYSSHGTSAENAKQSSATTATSPQEPRPHEVLRPHHCWKHPLFQLLIDLRIRQSGSKHQRFPSRVFLTTSRPLDFRRIRWQGNSCVPIEGLTNHDHKRNSSSESRMRGLCRPHHTRKSRSSTCQKGPYFHRVRLAQASP